jgi:hypothetical protein
MCYLVNRTVIDIKIDCFLWGSTQSIGCLSAGA